MKPGHRAWRLLKQLKQLGRIGLVGEHIAKRQGKAGQPPESKQWPNAGAQVCPSLSHPSGHRLVRQIEAQVMHQPLGRRGHEERDTRLFIAP